MTHKKHFVPNGKTLTAKRLSLYKIPRMPVLNDANKHIPYNYGSTIATKREEQERKLMTVDH